MAFSQQFIPIIFSSIFTSAVVGYYAMANRLLRLPAIVLTTSISDVFRNEAVERVRDNGNCSSLYKKTVSRLIVIALPIFTIIYLVSPFAIKLVLGEKWLMSGYFAQVLCILLFFEFISQPLNSLFYIFEMQKIYMRIQFLNSVLGVLVIYASYKFFEDAKIVLFCFARAGIVQIGRGRRHAAIIEPPCNLCDANALGTPTEYLPDNGSRCLVRLQLMRVVRAFVVAVGCPRADEIAVFLLRG